MSVDIFRLLDKVRASWDHIESAQHAIDDAIAKLRTAETYGYLGVLYRTEYEVESVRHAEFPIDMLRYTQSWPTRETDATAIAQLCGGAREALGAIVSLTKLHRDAKPELAEARWDSKFGWRVVRVVDTRLE